jgi:hypothetical protein
MATQGGNQGGQEATIGLGNETSGEEGATPDHESMAETGGSGGDALTQPRRIESAPYAGARDAAQEHEEAEGENTAATAIARGAQDTRSAQASPGSTGLGTPETGGNQSERDLAPPRSQ